MTHALLIGVGHYFPNTLSDGGSYPSLEGAVPDIKRVEEFLIDSLKVAPERIRKLAITASLEGVPPEPPEMWPTYENMVKALQCLAEEVSPEDEVYIHYSGHGGRTPTRCRNKESKVDECLVPCDIGNSSARYLRDVELSRLLQRIAAKQPRMTVVLDCCHAGGATRGRGKAVKRGRSTIDTTPRPGESLVGYWDDLTEEWRRVKSTNGATKRNLSVQSWMPRSDAYVLFAACRPQESAFEYPFDDGEPQGALTYWLLDTVRRSGPGVICKELQDRLVAKIHTKFCYQTPMLLGNPDRAFLGGNGGASRYAVNVLDVTKEGRILLNAGESQGMSEGARLTIQTNGRAVLVEIEQAGATESWARLVNVTRDVTLGPIEQGAQAILLQPGRIELQSAVQLVRQDGLPAGIQQDAALDRVRSLLVRPGESGFLRLAGEDDAAAYQVIVTPQGEYEIWDSDGEPVPHVRPPLPVDAPGAAQEAMRRLVHLTRWRNVQELENFDDVSPLARKIRLEIVGTQADYKPGTKPNPRPYGGPAGCVDLAVGEWLFVKLVNRSSQTLNMVVLDLQPDWGIQQVFPGKNDTAFWPLDPGDERMLRIQGSLPDGYDEGIDILKAIGTLGAPDFRWLELPALDKPQLPSNKRGLPRGALNQLFAALAAHAPRKRHLNPSEFASEEWGTAQVEVRVRR